MDAIVTHHTDSFASGVARFNEILAEHLGVPLLSLYDERASQVAGPLLSFKITEMSSADREVLDGLLERLAGRAQLFLHDWGGSAFERGALTRVSRVWCANSEIHDHVRVLVPDAACVWAPSLIVDRRPFEPTELSVFSFGMAHKIRVAAFRRLRELLEASGRSYAIYVSSANHETSTMGEAQSVYEEMHLLFPDRLFFMGNLSDVAVCNYLRGTTFFASFFPQGVRANNTSVNAAMEQGCVVITNLDARSPAHLVHMKNVIDIDECVKLPSDPLVLKRMSEAAVAAVSAYGWSPLIRELRSRRRAASQTGPESFGRS